MPASIRQILSYPLPLCDEALQLPWYIALTLPRQEGIAAAGLIGRRFSCWYPTERKSVKLNGNTRTLRFYPMFPGYVFISFDALEDAWKRINVIPGVRRVLTVGEKPVPIASEAMEHIRGKERELIQRKVKRLPAILVKAGDWVQLVEHLSFTGLFGKVAATNRKTQRVTVELDLFGRVVPVLVSAEQVKVV